MAWEMDCNEGSYGMVIHMEVYTAPADLPVAMTDLASVIHMALWELVIKCDKLMQFRAIPWFFPSVSKENPRDFFCYASRWAGELRFSSRGKQVWTGPVIWDSHMFFFPKTSFFNGYLSILIGKVTRVLMIFAGFCPKFETSLKRDVLMACRTSVVSYFLWCEEYDPSMSQHRALCFQTLSLVLL